MISNKKVAANRLNASKSTGPRTLQGKSRARGNAWRHGWSAAIKVHSTDSADVERMAKAICGDHTTPAMYEQALIIAECEILLLNLRAARVAAIKHHRIVELQPKNANQIPGSLTNEEWTLAFEDLELGQPRAVTKLLTRAARAVLAYQAKRAEAEYQNAAQSRNEQSSQLPPASLDAAVQPASEDRQTPRTRDDVEAFQRALPELVRMNRYEKRALSRRKRAIRMFGAISTFAASQGRKQRR